LSNGDTINIASVEFSFKQNTEDKFPFNLNPAQDTLVMSSLDIKQITILVADIRGFTSFSEQAPIKLLTKLMSKWFYHVNECIISNGGTVDRFLGDCVYARWEADDDATQSIRNALRSACLINRISKKLREVYLNSKLPFKIGVGINTGHAAVMGGVGQDYTAIGDAVNTAFRLEKCTKRYKTDIILSHSSYQHLPKQCWADKAQQTKLRGKKEPVQICAFSFEQARSIVNKISD
jgi:adenylate cyclase